MHKKMAQPAGKSAGKIIEKYAGKFAGKYTRKIVGKFAAALAAGVLFAAIPGGGLTAWAGEWSQTEDGTWYYLEEGERVTGWQRIDGVWYCLDEESGAWIPKPSLTFENISYLLANYLTEQNMYQYEEYDVICRLEEEDENTITVSVGYEDRPGYFHTLNTYEISKKSGMADPVIGTDFSLWQEG